MKTRFILILCLVLSVFALGCDKPAEEAPAADPAAEAPAEAPAEEAPAEAAEEAPAAKVELTEEGTKFDPAIKVEQLPAGAFYCDMGTVHWAATKAPEDGNCPLCGMKLKQLDPEKLAEQEGGAVEAKPADDHGHAHDGSEEEGHAH